jgi:hypothetical protein
VALRAERVRAPFTLRRLDGDGEAQLLGDGAGRIDRLDGGDPVTLADEVEGLGQPRRVQDRVAVERDRVEVGAGHASATIHHPAAVDKM